MIADDIMVVGKQPNHKDHDMALTQLLKTARELMFISTTINYSINKQKSASLAKHTQ